jgi:hypothetical protein
VNYFYRVEYAFKAKYPGMRQKVNIFNVLLTIIPIVVPMGMIARKSTNNWEASLFAFTALVNSLSVLFPIVVARTGTQLASFCQVVNMMASLYFTNWHFIWFFFLAVPIAFIRFKSENTREDDVRKRIVAPFLLLSFIGLFFTTSDHPSIWASLAALAASLMAMILNK